MTNEQSDRLTDAPRRVPRRHDADTWPPDNRNLRRALWLMIWLTPVVAVGLPWVLP